MVEIMSLVALQIIFVVVVRNPLSLAIAQLILTLVNDYFFYLYKILLFSFWKLKCKDYFDKFCYVLPKF